MSNKLIKQPNISSATWDIFDAAVRNRKSKIVIAAFGLDESEENIVSTGTVKQPNTWQQVLDLFPADQVRWAIVTVKYRVAGGGNREKVLFVRWVPDKLSRETHKETIRVKSTGVMLGGDLAGRAVADGCVVLQANCKDDLTPKNVIEKLSANEREEVLLQESIDDLEHE